MHRTVDALQLLLSLTGKPAASVQELYAAAQYLKSLSRRHPEAPDLAQAGAAEPPLLEQQLQLQSWAVWPFVAALLPLPRPQLLAELERQLGASGCFVEVDKEGRPVGEGRPAGATRWIMRPAAETAHYGHYLETLDSAYRRVYDAEAADLRDRKAGAAAAAADAMGLLALPQQPALPPAPPLLACLLLPVLPPSPQRAPLAAGAPAGAAAAPAEASAAVAAAAGEAGVAPKRSHKRQRPPRPRPGAGAPGQGQAAAGAAAMAVEGKGGQARQQQGKVAAAAAASPAPSSASLSAPPPEARGVKPGTVAALEAAGLQRLIGGRRCAAGAWLCSRLLPALPCLALLCVALLAGRAAPGGACWPQPLSSTLCARPLTPPRTTQSLDPPRPPHLPTSPTSPNLTRPPHPAPPPAQASRWQTCRHRTWRSSARRWRRRAGASAT
jgi:hypothetical protein